MRVRVKIETGRERNAVLISVQDDTTTCLLAHTSFSKTFKPRDSESERERERDRERVRDSPSSHTAALA